MATKKRSKYGVDISKSGKEKRTYKGICYDSLTEMQFMKEYIEPKLQSGEIIKFERQVKYVLQEGFTMNDGTKILPIHYVSDFNVWWKDGTFTVFDIKGRPDNLSLIKRKLFRNKYRDINLVFICRNIKCGGWIPYDSLKKMKSEEKKKLKEVSK